MNEFAVWESKQAGRWMEYAMEHGHRDAQTWTDEDAKEYARGIIEQIDEDGWDEDIHGGIDIDMEGYAREIYDGTSIE